MSAEDTQNLLNQSLVVVEEGMEMVGVILFIGALLSYIWLYLPDLKLKLNVTPIAVRTSQRNSD